MPCKLAPSTMCMYSSAILRLFFGCVLQAAYSVSVHCAHEALIELYYGLRCSAFSV